MNKNLNNTVNLDLEYPYGRRKIIYNGLYQKNLKKIDAASHSNAEAARTAQTTADGAVEVNTAQATSITSLNTAVGMPYENESNINARLTALETAIGMPYTDESTITERLNALETEENTEL